MIRLCAPKALPSKSNEKCISRLDFPCKSRQPSGLASRLAGETAKSLCVDDDLNGSADDKEKLVECLKELNDQRADVQPEVHVSAEAVCQYLILFVFLGLSHFDASFSILR